MNEVFRKEFYSSSKKFYQRVTRMITLFERYEFSIKEMNEKDIKEAERLHEKWVEYKLNNYNLYRIMFPEKRYIRCLHDSLTPHWNGVYNVGVYDKDNVLRGFRVFYIIGDKGYDLAYITDREYEHNEFSEMFEINTLKYIKNKYCIKSYNCGLSTGKLKRFKQHLPNYEVVYYKYKKQKQ